MKIMVDLETMSTRPEAAIVAVGACTFDHPGVARERFYQTVDIESSQSQVLRLFARWLLAVYRVTDDSYKIPREATVWGNGAAFDNVILTSAYRNCNLPLPWTHKQDACYRTLTLEFPGVPKPVRDESLSHNALADAVAQAEHAEAIMRCMAVRG